MKKILPLITHPLVLIISFLFIIIIGEHLGGFYYFYILLALPHGGIHAVLAVIGIALLLLTKYIIYKDWPYFIHSILNIIGAVLLPLSLFLFFYRDKDNYNEDTLQQAVPLLLIIIFSLLSIIFIIDNFYKLFHRPSKKLLVPMK